MMERTAALLALAVAGAMAQCDNLPDGTSCDKYPNNMMFEDPTDCEMYYECVDGCAVRKMCERNFLFDNKFGYCNYPLAVDCGDRPCTDPEHCLTTVSTTTTTTTPDCGHFQDCSELGEGYHPDPFNCRKYWHCHAGLSDHITCPDDQLYDPDNIWCNWANLVDCGERPVCDDCDNNCGTTHKVTTTPTHSSTEDCGHVMDCTNMTDGWYADPFNCRKYWHCLEGEGEHLTCDGDLLYDPNNVWCNYPDLVDCGDRPVCGPCDDNCQTTTKPCDHPMDCTDMPDGWYADPYNCRKYWHCSSGGGQHFTCPGNELYNAQGIMCDFPDRVNCGQRPVCDDCDENCRPNSLWFEL